MQNARQNRIGKGAKLHKTLGKIQTLYKKNRLNEALQQCEWATTQGADSPEFLHTYGLILKRVGKPHEALVKIFAAHELQPESAKILNSLGSVFLDMNDLETAIVMFKRATEQDEKYFEAWMNLGDTLKIAGRLHAAELAFTAAHYLDLKHSEPLLQLALVYIAAYQFERSAEILDQLLQVHPNARAFIKIKRLEVAMQLEDMDYVNSHLEPLDKLKLNEVDRTNLQAVKARNHIIQDELDEAIEILEELAAKPGKNQPDHLSHLGGCYGLAGRLDEGIAALEKLMRISPEHKTGGHNLALLCFKAGKIEEGYDHYDTRMRHPDFDCQKYRFQADKWAGEPLDGKSIVIWKEQGIGDEVRFASLIPELHQQGAQVTLECSEKLVPLWEKSFPWANVRAPIVIPGNEETEKEPFDFQTPIGSLGSYLRRSIKDFDQCQKPWIARDFAAEEKIREQIAVQPDELLIGLCWRSSNQIASRDRDFLTCEELAPLKELPGTRWLNVQYITTEDEIDRIRETGLELHSYPDLDQMNDLVGACTLIGACDLVISVGVSVGDLVGGLGTPMLHIAPELSEIYLGTERIPWFPNSRSYRIKPFEAHKGIERIVDDWPSILEWLDGKNPRPNHSTHADTSGKLNPPLDLKYH